MITTLPLKKRNPVGPGHPYPGKAYRDDEHNIYTAHRDRFGDTFLIDWFTKSISYPEDLGHTAFYEVDLELTPIEKEGE